MKQSYKRILCLTVSLTTLQACIYDGWEPGATPPETNIDFASFDQAVDAAIAQWNASPEGQTAPLRGASSIVVSRDQGVIHSQGYGDFAADRLYLVASSSKILSVGVLMRLHDQGKLDIHTPISEYLSAWGEHKTNVNIAQLVSNSSGLPSLDEIDQAGTTEAGRTEYAAEACEFEAAGTLTDCGKGIYQDDAPTHNRQPDQTFRYGGSPWQLAGAIAEVVSGKSWDELSRETYAPCGLKTLGWTNQAGTDGVANFDYPPGFEADAANAPETDNPLIEGGAYLDASDYAQILLMHMRGGVCRHGRVLSADAVQTMRTARVAAYGGVVSTDPTIPFTDYGLGWWIAPTFIADPGAYGAFPLITSDGQYGAMLFFENGDAGNAVARAALPVLLSALTPPQ